VGKAILASAHVVDRRERQGFPRSTAVASCGGARRVGEGGHPALRPLRWAPPPVARCKRRISRRPRARTGFA